MPDKNNKIQSQSRDFIKGEVIDERRFTMPDFPNVANAQEGSRSWTSRDFAACT
jgi:hypothetical protein